MIHGNRRDMTGRASPHAIQIRVYYEDTDLLLG